MKQTVTLFALGLLLAGCKRHLSDSEISRKAVGVWTTSDTAITTEMRSDGTYITSGASNGTAGLWNVEDGYIVVTITNVSGHVVASGVYARPRFKVVGIDNHQMTFVPQGNTTSVTLTKP